MQLVIAVILAFSALSCMQLVTIRRTPRHYPRPVSTPGLDNAELVMLTSRATGTDIAEKRALLGGIIYATADEDPHLSA